MDDKKGALKDYVEVNVRIMKFYEKYPEGRLHTEIVSWDNGTVVMKATAYRDNTDIIAATGHAYEKENSSFINKTSALENCETSAIGRALGILGFEIKKGIASKEEVENAKINQQLGDEKTNELIGQVIMLGASKGLTMPMVLLGVRKDYKKDIKELTDKQFDELFEKISKLPDKEIQNAD